MIRRGRAGVFLSRVFLRLPGGGVDDDSAAPGVDNFFVPLRLLILHKPGARVI